LYVYNKSNLIEEDNSGVLLRFRVCFDKYFGSERSTYNEEIKFGAQYIIIFLISGFTILPLVYSRE
jgi:hypothetical protein